MFRDTNLVLATAVVEEAVGAAFSDYYNLHPNERGMPRVLAQIPHSPEPEPEPRPFARFSKVDDLSVCNSAVDSVLSGALDQYYCLHPEERPRAQHFPRPMDVREVSVDSEARPAPRRSVDFLTLPLDERIANEAIAGALEEYNRIHGDHRPSLARLPQIGGSGGISSMSKHVNDSSSGPCFISPRKTLDEEVADSVISTALSDYYNLHPNERPRQGAGAGVGSVERRQAFEIESGGGKQEGKAGAMESFPSAQKQQVREGFPSMQKPPSTEAFPSMQKPTSDEAFPSMQRPPSTEAFPSMQKPAAGQAFPSMQRPPSTESFPSMQRPPSTESFPSMQRPPSTESFPSMQRPPSTESFPSMQRPPSTESFPSMQRPPSTESFPSMQKPAAGQAFPSMQRPAAGQAFPSMQRPPSTESFPSMQKPASTEAFPSMQKPAAGQAFPSMQRPPSTESFPSMQKPASTESFPSMQKPVTGQAFPSMQKPAGQAFPSMQKPAGQAFPSMQSSTAKAFPSLANSRAQDDLYTPTMVRSNTEGSMTESVGGHKIVFSTEDWVEQVIREAIADYKQMKQSIGMPTSSSQQRFNIDRTKVDRRPPLPKSNSPVLGATPKTIPEISDVFVTEVMNEAVNEYYNSHPALKRPESGNIIHPVTRDGSTRVHAMTVKPVHPEVKPWTREAFIEEVLQESLEQYYCMHPDKRHGTASSVDGNVAGAQRPRIPPPPMKQAFPSMPRPQSMEGFSSMMKPASGQAFPSMQKPASGQAFPSMQKPAPSQAFPSMQKPASGEAFPSMQKPAAGQAFPSMQRPPSTESFPSMQKPASGEAFPSMQKPVAGQAFPSMQRPPSTESFPSMQRPPSTESFPSMQRPPSTESFPSMQKPASTEAFPSMQKPAAGQAFPSMQRQPSTESFPSMQRPASGEAFPSVQKPASGDIRPHDLGNSCGDSPPVSSTQRKSVDFLTLPLDERIVDEAIAGALEEYNRIHGDHRPSLARLPQIGGSGGISSMSKHVNDSPSGPCFISPRKTLDEEVADSVISTALSDYYNLHPNERPRPVAAKPQEKPELVQHPREMTVVPPSWKPIEQIEREVVDTVVESALRQYYSMHPEERPRNT